MLTEINDLKNMAGATGEIRAGGTDLQDRYRMGISDGPIIDIFGLPDMRGITRSPDGATTIGALATIDEVAKHPLIAGDYMGISQTANGLATPQIRWAATIGGALLQRTRCAYYRHPDLPCTKKGDDHCGAREGVHTNGVLFDRGGCAHPHPSSLGMALLAYEADVKTSERPKLSVPELYGDGSDHARDHLLAEGEILTHVVLPPPAKKERTAYFRSISRFEAEWPIVECMVRLTLEGKKIGIARVAVGGVCQVPLRLENVESALIGRPATEATFAEAAQQSIEGANPLPDAAWKLKMLTGTVLTTLEMAVAG